MPVTGRNIHINGLVQGVGFRPFVWRLANEAGLSGHVLNDGAGVSIQAWGDSQVLDAFVDRLKKEAPPLARIDSIDWHLLYGAASEQGFRIVQSTDSAISTAVVPDAATCPECLAEMMDPENRRYGYPFINCTHCGPRLSIIEAIPYDRANTSMRAFKMCPDCAREYEDPADRRFHAQPNACAVCGPQIWLEDRAGPLECNAPLAETVRLLKTGAIIAIKGIGGFHLACDATSETAVVTLRQRKRRAAKPLAVMARDIEQIRGFCLGDAAEADLLKSSAATIMLLNAASGSLPREIAPGQSRIGVMLPYTPLHHLLMAALDRPIVLTSGNLSSEPQAIDNSDAHERLAGIADIWLMHDRDIVNRLDDSVMRLDRCGPQILRRARGLAPAPLPLGQGFADAPPILAMGGELKSTFCVLRQGQAVVSQHLGDLEEAATYADYRKTILLYRNLFQFDPQLFAIDQHPDYLSSRWGRTLAAETGARLVEVQHHHAHLASCLAENGVNLGDDLSVGVILDGLGLGTDGTIWGGEILTGGYRGFERAGHFLPVALPGGAQAQREPWRNTVAHLNAAFGKGWGNRIADTALGEMLTAKPVGVIMQMIAAKLNAPLSSSAGRLFDAIAAAIGICPHRQHYEGQAAMEMEALALPHCENAIPYPVTVSMRDGVRNLSWAPLWEALISDLKRKTEPGIMAARFHLGLAGALAETAIQVAAEAGTWRVALSGGVMQNRILLQILHQQLTANGLHVLVQSRLPANDGGLSLGQAVIAAAATPNSQ